MFDKNEIKKDLYKSKVIAKFSHYVSGNLYYIVELESGVYQFSMPTVENKIEYSLADDGGDELEFEYIDLSSDLGTTTFYSEMKGSELNRWIAMAIDKNEFIKVG